MISITCPNCQATYRVDRASLPPDGRPVRCARCRNVWNAVLPELEILPPECDRRVEGGPGNAEAPRNTGARMLPELPSRDLTLSGGMDGMEAAGASRARRAARFAVAGAGDGGRPASVRRLHGFVLGVAIALAAAGAYHRAEIVRVIPSTAGLYSRIGLPVNLRGLAFEDVTPRHVFEDGLPALIIEGRVVNLRAESTPVPALRFALRGASGAQLYAWTVEPRQTSLDPGASMPFRTRLAAPPAEAENVQVRFAGAMHRTIRATQ